MAQAQSVQEHLTAVRDELKSAAQKNDADARTHVNAALQHAQMAMTNLKSQAAASSAEACRHLDELAKNGKQALSESGDALHARIDTMMTNAKSAVEASKKA